MGVGPHDRAKYEVFMTGLVQDLRHAVRMLARRPGLSAITILILTLGIGGSVASFSVVDAALLRPLPFDRPDGLFSVWERPPQGAPWTRQTVPFALFEEWERQSRSFEQLGGYTGRDFVLLGRQGPQQSTWGRRYARVLCRAWRPCGRWTDAGPG